jgi:hypothetical protein
VSHLDAIEDATALVPEKFLATRSVSVSPRGLLHVRNRPFSRLFAAADLPPGSRIAASPELALRRLDEGTCPGCHQSRGVAGFHLLGEERDPARVLNALAVGHSPHLGAELPWRARLLADVASGRIDIRASMPPRPFSAHPDGASAYGVECGIGHGFESWKCAPGLVCRDLHRGDIGTCAPPTGVRPGEPCEAVSMRPDSRPEGPVITSAGIDPTCPLPPHSAQFTGPFCAPNWLGFTGGMCSVLCSKVGEIEGGSICAPLPTAGYEADCFYNSEPVETCLERHFINARIATCDRDTPCRDDYACARVPGAPAGVGACIPPYFVFQLRIDGPILDR